MKNSEILLACAVLSIVAGSGAALAAGAFLGAPAPRASTAAPAGSAGETSGPGADPEFARELDALRLENTGLAQRLAALERQLAEGSTTRVPLANPLAETALAAGDSPELARLLSGDVTNEFVARVGEAVAVIEAREEAEREAKRKVLQAERIEAKVVELEAKLGLSKRQSSDLRTTLTNQDDKREKLFAAMREEQGDPRGLRDGFRTIRDETMAELETFLTPEQVEGYKQSEEREWGRGGGERGGPPGFGGAPEGTRPQRDGR